MSNEALTAIAKSGIKPSGRKFVAMALADYADEAWECFPSVGALARYTAQGERTVRDHLAALEADGIIARKRKRRRDGTLGGYRFAIQRRNLPLDAEKTSGDFPPVADFARGEKQPLPAAKSAGQDPSIEPSDSTMEAAGEEQRAGPLPDHWQPGAAERDLALGELNFSMGELDDAAAEFRAYWRDRSERRTDWKTDWDRTFRNRLRELAKRWGTRRRPAPDGRAAGGKRSGNGSLADAAFSYFGQGKN